MIELTGKVLSSATNGGLIKIGDRILSSATPLGLKEGDSVSLISDSDSSDIFEINNKKFNLKDVTVNELLKAKNIPQTGNAKAGASVLLSLGKDVNMANLNKASANLDTAINKFGEANLKEIMFLNVLEIEVTSESLKFAKFLMNLSNTTQNLISSFSVLSDLLPDVFKKLMNQKFASGKGLFLNFGKGLTGKDILSFLQLLGYRNREKPGLVQIIKNLSQIIKHVDIPEKFMKEGEFTSSFVDSQKFNYIEGNENFYFSLPVTVDENQQNINFEYNFDEEEGHNLNLSLELETLGPLRVSVNMKKREFDIKIYVTTDQSRKIIETDLNKLSENLSKNDLKIRSIKIYKANSESIKIRDFPVELKPEIISTFETMG